MGGGPRDREARPGTVAPGSLGTQLGTGSGACNLGDVPGACLLVIGVRVRRSFARRLFGLARLALLAAGEPSFGTFLFSHPPARRAR